jgi:hypothetical protein
VEPEFRPDRILRVLREHEIEFVLIGGLAATAHGSPLVTRDVDITPSRSRDNLVRLSAALKELGARIRTSDVPDGIPFDHDAESLERIQVLNLVTEAGDLDVSFTPTGTAGFGDLHRGAILMRPFGIPTDVASLADVVRSKEAANRVKDQAALPTLRRLLEAEEDERRRDHER